MLFYKIKISTLFVSTVVTIVFLSAFCIAMEKFMPNVTAVAENMIIKTFSHASVKKYNTDDLITVPISETQQNNNLILVNKSHPISEQIKVDTVEFRQTELFVDGNITEPLEQLIAAVNKNTSDRLFLMSTYRTAEEQQKFYEENSKTANHPGTSEHQTGLALDVYVKHFAGDGFLKSEAGKFVNLNCHKYGFIIRYDFGKSNLTGVPFEPWHLRYVGAPHAEIMYKNDLSFEEYIEGFEPNVYYCSGEYILARLTAENDCIKMPPNVENITISPDNTGYYFVTAQLTAAQA